MSAAQAQRHDELCRGFLKWWEEVQRKKNHTVYHHKRHED